MSDALDRSVWDRLGIASLFGLGYFVAWPLWDGYVEFSDVGNFQTSNGPMAIAVVAALLSVYIIRGKPKKNLSKALLILLVLCWAALQLFGYRVYHLMSMGLGYFDDPPVVLAQVVGEPFSFEDMAFTITLPATWQVSKLMPLGAVYFVRHEQGSGVAQLRPKCFHNSRLPLARLVQGHMYKEQSRGLQVGKQCYRGASGTVSCILTHQLQKEKQRIWRTRWFSVNPDSRQAVELDFLVYRQDPVLEQEILGIIASTRFTPETQLPGCVRIMDWL